ncbi:MAG TPA: hypothetical protein VK177_17660 [Flavobacteriales bacterium]|nr:hypothetical protein [Flavobacteriales bacterium]
MNIELLPGEEKINNWTLLYSPPTGGKYNGKLVVTNKRLLYDAKFDVSAKGLVEEALFVKYGSEAFVSIPKERIKSITPEKSFFAKKAVIELDNGDKHIFNYGMLNIDPVIEAMKLKS